jgi:hypothetical protein
MKIHKPYLSRGVARWTLSVCPRCLLDSRDHASGSWSDTHYGVGDDASLMKCRRCDFRAEYWWRERVIRVHKS